MPGQTLGLQAKISPEVDRKSQRKITKDVEQAIGKAEEFSPTADGSFKGRTTPDGSRGMGGFGGAAAGAAAGGKGSGLLSKVGGAGGAALLGTVALGGVVATQMLGAMQKASGRLQASTSILGSAMSLFFKPFGDALGETILPFAKAGLEMAVQFNKIADDKGLKVGIAWLGSQAEKTLGNTFGDFPTDIPSPETVLSDFIGDFSWDSFVNNLSWDLFVPDLLWRGFIAPLKWGVWLGKLVWDNWLSKLGWGDWLNVLKWATFLNPLMWPTYVSTLIWDDWLDGLNWGDWLDPLDWGDWIDVPDWLESGGSDGGGGGGGDGGGGGGPSGPGTGSDIFSPTGSGGGTQIGGGGGGGGGSSGSNTSNVDSQQETNVNVTLETSKRRLGTTTDEEREMKIRQIMSAY